jgi:hypothetical protein
VFDVFGRAVCPDCGSVWQSAMRGKDVVLVTAE